MECSRLFLAIDAGGTFFKSALITEDGQIEKNSRISCPVDSEGQAGSVRDAYHWLIEKQMEVAKNRNSNIAAIGIDTPGPFDYTKGESRMLHKFRLLYGIPIRPWIEEKIGKVPIRFLHDSTAFLLGEYWKGELKDCNNCAGVMLGTGLGFACMRDGKVQLNEQGGPGYSLYNRPFGDGNAEDYVSRRGICRRYRDRNSDCVSGVDVVDIAEFAKKGDPMALDTFEETGRMLGEILLPVLRQAPYKRLVIGGQISKAYPYFGPALESVLNGTGLDMIGPSRCPDDSHLLGCAYSIINQ